MNLPITNSCVIYQFQRTGDKESYSTAPIYENINVCLSPMGVDIQNGFGDVPSFQQFEAYFMDVTLSINNGDKIHTNDGQDYLVDGIPFVMNNNFTRFIRCLVRQVV